MDLSANDNDDADESMEVFAAGVDDEGEIMAAVVVDDDDGGVDEEDNEAEADAVVVPAAPAKTRGPSHKKKKGGGKSSSKKKKKNSSTGGGKDEQRFSRISSDRLDAAAKARHLLLDGAPTLPLVASDIHVRCFGRLSIEPATNRSKFSKANALFPVGYSCDRYEFSPVHGRILKLRCTILEGKMIKETQAKMAAPIAGHLHDGPVFRIMWGQGIDEDKDEVHYPYDPYSMSAPLSSEQVDAVAIPTTSEGQGKQIIPTSGMRVQAVFDQGQVCHGTIHRVGNPNEPNNNTRKRKQVEIEIQYDDGSMEIIMFPDPEISLRLPEAEPCVDCHGHVEHSVLNGLPVHTVIGMSPIEAWGKVMAKLGLTDEVIAESAMKAMVSSRTMGLMEAKGKIESKGRRKSFTDTDGGDDISDGTNSDSEDAPLDASLTEDDLTSKISFLRGQLEDAKVWDRAAAVHLADKRISALGSYLSNPFNDKDPQQPQLANWLALAVRKEKTKMGSTGNKKKIVTATDLLERNDTFYNAEIEALIEGLPGSEYCSSYIFQSMRTGGVAATNRAWVHEAQVRSDKEREKRMKATSQKNAQVFQQKEKEVKRKKRDDIRDERKRQRIEEEEEKKKARIDERLARLSLQVEDRLFKEACFQREKAIVALSKTFAREYNRRRRAAEIVAGQLILDTERGNGVVSETELLPFPKFSKVYDEDVLRVWDFVSTFGVFFIERGYMKAVPPIDSLQSAIDTLREIEAGGASIRKEDATASLIELAVALCKPLAASQTRLLFASLIALYPVLQKEFGAAFFNEVNEVKNSEKKETGSETPNHENVLLPVDALTWQEIARLALLSDALGELGYSRQDSAHLLRGYRSAGHPNSKESRRLRRVEDFSIALLRQALSDGTQRKIERRPNVVRIEIPTTPSCLTSDWLFYLHNVRWMKSSDVLSFKKNVSKALAMLKADTRASVESTDILNILENCIGMIQQDSADAATLKKAKQQILDFLDGQTEQRQTGSSSKKDSALVPSNHQTSRKDGTEFSRQQMGLLRSLSLTYPEYRKLVHSRDEYMSEAMKLKEEMERQRRKENNEGDEDDDFDDDDDDDEEEPMGTSNEKGTVTVASLAEVAAAVVASGNGKKSDSPEDNSSSVERIKSEDPEGGSANQERIASNSQFTTKSPDAALKFNNEYGAEGTKIMDDEMNSGHSKGAKIEIKAEKEVEAMCMDGRSTWNNEEEAARTDQEPKPKELCTPIEADNRRDSEMTPSDHGRIGKPTQYDDFCGDIPTAPELLRRCLAVLRSLSLAGPSEPFLYPVDPQTNPGYYDTVLRPMCLWKVGKILQAKADRLSQLPGGEDTAALDDLVDKLVLEFGRNIRLIAQNCHAYANAGPMVISAGGEFLRIFERLLLDWVLAPASLLTPLHELDDDKCVEHHASDEDSTVLLCDGCEGNFNISRLDPPLTSVPKGDWYCPRCVSGRWWGHLDPRIGKCVQHNEVIPGVSFNEKAAEECLVQGEIKECFFRHPEGSDSTPSLLYKVAMTNGRTETWTLEAVDRSLEALGEVLPPVRCIAALAESQGYGCAAPDKSLLRELVPVPLNPTISDGAAQAALSSSVFRDTIYSSGTLMLINPEDMKASEWLTLLLLLVMKCSASDVMQNLASKLEAEAAEAMTKDLELIGKVSDLADVLDDVYDDDEGNIFTNEDTGGERILYAKEPLTTHQESDWGVITKLETSVGGDLLVKDLNEDMRPTAMEVEPSAVEVVSASPSGAPPQEVDAVAESKEISVADQVKERRSAALAEKMKRQKAREDSIAAFGMKNQLRPTVASFEEDAVSHVIDSALASTLPGLSFASNRCRGVACDFCGLTDVTLGAPLVRVPDESEWNEFIAHAARSRRVLLIANMQGKGVSDITATKTDAGLRKSPKNKFVSLTIRIGDDLMSLRESEEVFDRTEDGGMLEFCPRNSEGFQSELAFRSQCRLPFITGSLSAHECCAVATHRARKILVVQRFKERQLELADANAGMTCGRTLAIGKDNIGRFYWKFHKDPDSLFVFVPGRLFSGERGQWHRFSDPQSIASVIISLGKDSFSKDLKRAYPNAAKMCRMGSWSNLIWSRCFPNAIKAMKNADENSSENGSVDGRQHTRDNEIEEPPFEVNEAALVESKSGKLLWDAKVLEVSRTDNDKVIGYRVRYTGWSSRFDEWVDRDRLVEPSDNNRQVQYEMLEESATQRDGLPPELSRMEALRFLRVRDRARGSERLPDFAYLVQAGVGASTDARKFAVLKAAVLLIEAALPIGSVDTTSRGPWKMDLAQEWRLMVERAEGPGKLMRCVILLEDVLTEEWVKPDVGHLRSCLPNRWKALGEVSVASLAIRVQTLDRAILYALIDKKRWVESSKKKR